MDESGIQSWAASLPSGIEAQPQYWIAAGMWAEKQGETGSATRAYWQAASLDENDGEALTKLGTSLAELGGVAESKRVSERAGLVTAMRDDVESLFFWRNHSQRAAVRIAKSMQRLGRIWEAATWARIAVTMTQDPDDDARSVFTEIREHMTGRTPWQTTDSLVTNSIDVATLPAVDWSPTNRDAPKSLAQASSDSFHFSDEAQQRGLNHTCEINKPDGDEAGLWIYQSGAGGAGVIDYDADGWPDFYLTSCDGTPKQSNSKPNRLFRSLAAEYVDVTRLAGVGDREYSQGVAVGNYNSDGFADLFVGNFGQNRLLRNNGDGTFTDVTKSAGLVGDAWTTSVAIADLDGDAIADLYEVNYIAGDDVITQLCFPDRMTTHRSCGPLVFPAEPDRIFRGRGDGTFADVGESWLTNQDAGRGLGLVVGMLDDQPGVNVYVSNDMTANQFWSADKKSESDFSFVEQAASRLGRALVCVDANRDRKPDLLITHLFDRVSLLINQSAAATGPPTQLENSIRFHLVGTKTHRDAVGATVTIEIGKKTWTHQLLSGNGYQCANERCLHFGVGAAELIDRVSVTWPDGEQQTSENLEANHGYLWVEGTSPLPVPPSVIAGRAGG